MWMASFWVSIDWPRPERGTHQNTLHSKHLSMHVSTHLLSKSNGSTHVEMQTNLEKHCYPGEDRTALQCQRNTCCLQIIAKGLFFRSCCCRKPARSMQGIRVPFLWELLNERRTAELKSCFVGKMPCPLHVELALEIACFPGFSSLIKFCSLVIDCYV